MSVYVHDFLLVQEANVVEGLACHPIGRLKGGSNGARGVLRVHLNLLTAAGISAWLASLLLVRRGPVTPVGRVGQLLLDRPECT